MLELMFEVTHLSLETANMRTQVGVGRVELAQLTGMGRVVMRRWGRWWCSTEVMTTLGTVLNSHPASPGLLTAAGVR